MFYITAIVTGILFLLCLAIKESRPSLLLKRKVKHLRNTSVLDFYETQNPDHIPNLRSFIDVTMIRPIRLVVTEPILIIVSFCHS